MEKQLQINDHKYGWQNCDPLWLLERLREETQELEQEVRQWVFVDGLPRNRTITEAADVANFAMFIADIVNADICDNKQRRIVNNHDR